MAELGDRSIRKQNPRSVLFITLDSCRYDTFAQADIPHLKSVGPLHRAMAPGNFTYASHAAMFLGFTPGIAERQEAFINPKFAKIFRMATGGIKGKAEEFAILHGRNIIDGYRRRGYLTVGTAAVGWFDPSTETGALLTQEFERFHYRGMPFSVDEQFDWLAAQLATAERPVFVFMNIGETHVPYCHEGADWGWEYNPCTPFSEHNDAALCRQRQSACLEFVDRRIGSSFGRRAGGGSGGGQPQLQGHRGIGVHQTQIVGRGLEPRLHVVAGRSAGMVGDVEERRQGREPDELRGRRRRALIGRQRRDLVPDAPHRRHRRVEEVHRDLDAAALRDPDAVRLDPRPSAAGLAHPTGYALRQLEIVRVGASVRGSLAHLRQRQAQCAHARQRLVAHARLPPACSTARGPGSRPPFPHPREPGSL